MLKAIKVRLYPNNEQEIYISKLLGSYRFVYNQCLDKKITDWGKIKTVVKDSTGDFLWKKTKRRPMIVPIIVEV